MTELREAIAERLRAANGIPCAAENVLVTAGLSEAVFDLLCTVLDEGDELLIPDPVWINYLNVPALFGAKPVSYSLTEENGFEPSLEEMRAKVTPRTKAIVLLTPCNPTGGVLSRAKARGDSRACEGTRPARHLRRNLRAPRLRRRETDEHRLSARNGGAHRDAQTASRRHTR